MAGAVNDEPARRPWYKKKRCMTPLALIVLLAIISVLPDEPNTHVDRDVEARGTTTQLP